MGCLMASLILRRDCRLGLRSKQTRLRLWDERESNPSWRARVSAGFLPLKEMLDLINPWGGS